MRLCSVEKTSCVVISCRQYIGSPAVKFPPSSRRWRVLYRDAGPGLGLPVKPPTSTPLHPTNALSPFTPPTMGWFWNDSTTSGSSTKDPFHRLNPDVREFLLRESPLKPAPAPTPAPTSTTAEPTSEHPTTPSKYGDRYADIWEQYRSPHEQETARSAQEQLSDIIQAYKWRKGAIGRAALENCADQQSALYTCYQHGGVRDRFTTCSAYSHKLQDCYMTQAVCFSFSFSFFPPPLPLFSRSFLF